VQPKRFGLQGQTLLKSLKLMNLLAQQVLPSMSHQLLLQLPTHRHKVDGVRRLAAQPTNLCSLLRICSMVSLLLVPRTVQQLYYT
jgi:hypothetical protein